MKMFPLPAASQRIAPLVLAARTTHQLHDRAGERVVCLDGQVWITQHHDARDIVLQAGECFELDRPGLAIVYALADAVVTVSVADKGAAPCAEAA